MASKTQIVNIALNRIGVSKQVANVDTENSREALSAKIIFDDDRDYVLRDFAWPWATGYAVLGLVAGTSSVPVNGDWQYAYRYPSDAIFIRRIVTPGLGRNDPNPPAFRVGSDVQGRLLYTNQPEVTVEYTRRVTDAGEFDAVFTSMLAWRLGAMLAPALSRMTDAAKLCLQMYDYEKSRAETRALNEGQQDTAPQAEWIRGR